MSDFEVPKERRDALRKVLHDIVYSENMDEYVDYLLKLCIWETLALKSIFMTIGTTAQMCGFLFNEIVAFTLVTQQITGWSVVTVSLKI